MCRTWFGHSDPSWPVSTQGYEMNEASHQTMHGHCFLALSSVLLSHVVCSVVQVINSRMATGSNCTQIR